MLLLSLTLLFGVSLEICLLVYTLSIKILRFNQVNELTRIGFGFA